MLLNRSSIFFFSIFNVRCWCSTFNSQFLSFFSIFVVFDLRQADGRVGARTSSAPRPCSAPIFYMIFSVFDISLRYHIMLILIIDTPSSDIDIRYKTFNFLFRVRSDDFFIFDALVSLSGGRPVGHARRIRLGHVWH